MSNTGATSENQFVNSIHTKLRLFLCIFSDSMSVVNDLERFFPRTKKCLNQSFRSQLDQIPLSGCNDLNSDKGKCILFNSFVYCMQLCVNNNMCSVIQNF